MFCQNRWGWFLKLQHSFTPVGFLCFAINNTALYFSLERYSLRSVYFHNTTEWKLLLVAIFLVTGYVEKPKQFKVHHQLCLMKESDCLTSCWNSSCISSALTQNSQMKRKSEFLTQTHKVKGLKLLNLIQVAVKSLTRREVCVWF